MLSWCWKNIAVSPVVRPVALIGLITSLTIGAAEAQEFQFPSRPFGLGAASNASNATRAEIKKSIDRAGLDYDRNAAWPTPFREMDRATYYQWFQPCLDRGWEMELTLSDACFDGSGKLNRLGAAKVMQAVRHSPQDRRSVFVWGETPEIAQARIELVQQHLQTEFGRSANLMVAGTQNFPVTGRGSYAESVTRAFNDNLPRPVLNVQPVAGSVEGE